LVEPLRREENDLDVMVAAIFEARMSREQAKQLARLMEEARPTRPEGVLTAALLVEGEDVKLVAVWRDRATLDAYLAEAAVPRGTELMRKVGVEPKVRVVDVLDLG
jgi:quinol monooxygenase YgiN